MIRVHLVFDIWNMEAGRQRAEREVDLNAVPRIGELIWVAKVLSLRVSAVSWMLESSSAPDPRPWIWLGRGTGTTATIKDLKGDHEVPPDYVDMLVNAGFVLSPND
jgi:hypothetical protein